MPGGDVSRGHRNSLMNVNTSHRMILRGEGTHETSTCRKRFAHPSKRQQTADLETCLEI